MMARVGILQRGITSLAFAGEKKSWYSKSMPNKGQKKCLPQMHTILWLHQQRLSRFINQTARLSSKSSSLVRRKTKFHLVLTTLNCPSRKSPGVRTKRHELVTLKRLWRPVMRSSTHLQTSTNYQTSISSEKGRDFVKWWRKVQLKKLQRPVKAQTIWVLAHTILQKASWSCPALPSCRTLYKTKRSGHLLLKRQSNWPPKCPDQASIR